MKHIIWCRRLALGALSLGLYISSGLLPSAAQVYMNTSGVTPGNFAVILNPNLIGDSGVPQNSIIAAPTGTIIANHIPCWLGTAALLRPDCTDSVSGAIIGPTTFTSQSPGLNVKPTSASSVGAYFEGYGSANNLSNFPLYIAFRDYSVSHSIRLDIQAVNQAGSVLDSSAFINPGLNWWTTGHEQTDIDIGGYINGVGGKVLIAIGSGCNAAANNSIGGPACPNDLNPSISPGSNGLLDVGGYNNRFNNIYSVKSQIRPIVDQNLLIAGNLHLSGGMSFQSYLDNLTGAPLELNATNIEFYVLNGFTRTRINTDKNLTIQDKLNLASGVSIQSLDETLAIAKPLEIVGSNIQITGTNILHQVPNGYNNTRVGTNQNLYIGGPVNLGSGMAIQSLNDALNAFQNIEINGTNIRLSVSGGGGLLIGAAPGVTCPAGTMNITTMTSSFGILTHC